MSCSRLHRGFSRLGLSVAATLLLLAFTPVAHADTPGEIARAILGHSPRGLARTIVQRGYMRVANDSNYPPFSSIDPSTKKIVGFDVDVARAVGDILGLGVHFRHPAWEWVPRGLVSARYFEVSIGGMKNTWQRRQTLAFTSAYYHLAAQVLIRKGGPQVTGPESLQGRRVAATRSTYLRYLRNHTEARPVECATYMDALSALVHRRVPMWLLSGVFARRLAADDARLELTGPPLFWDRCAVAVRKGEPDLVALLDHAVRELQRRGDIQVFIERWFGTGEQGIRP